MRTFFDIVLGILGTVLKACLHALVSTAGVVAFGGAVAFGGIYIARRISQSRVRSAARSAKIAEVVSIDR